MKWEGNEVVTSNEKLAQTCSIFCEYCVPSFSFTYFHENDDVNNDNIDNTMTKCEGHPSLIAILNKKKK